jgi:ATP-dependent DNA helicase RecG
MTEDYSYFITTLPIHPAFLPDDGINDGVSDGINDGINEIVNILLNVSGLSAIEIASRIDKSIPTVERYIRILRRRDIIEYRGSKKTGGYHLTETAKDKLK